MVLWAAAANFILAVSGPPFPASSLQSRALNYTNGKSQKGIDLSSNPPAPYPPSESHQAWTVSSYITEIPKTDSTGTPVFSENLEKPNTSSQTMSQALRFPGPANPDEKYARSSSLKGDPARISPSPPSNLHSLISHALLNSYSENPFKDPEGPLIPSTKGPSKRASLGYGAWNIILTALDNGKKTNVYLDDPAVGDRGEHQATSQPTGGDPANTSSLNIPKASDGASNSSPWDRPKNPSSVSNKHPWDTPKGSGGVTVTNPWGKPTDHENTFATNPWDRTKGSDGVLATNPWDRPKYPDGASVTNSWERPKGVANSWDVPKGSDSISTSRPWERPEGLGSPSNFSTASPFFPSFFPSFSSSGEDKVYDQKETSNNTAKKPSKFGHAVGASINVHFPRVTTEGGTGASMGGGSFLGGNGNGSGVGEVTVKGEGVTVGAEGATIQGSVPGSGWVSGGRNKPGGSGGVSLGGGGWVSTGGAAWTGMGLDAGGVTKVPSGSGGGSWMFGGGGGLAAEMSGKGGWVAQGSVGMTEPPCGGRCPGGAGTSVSGGRVSGEGSFLGSGVSESGGSWGVGWEGKRPCGRRCPGREGTGVSGSGGSGGGGWVKGGGEGVTDRPCGGRCPGGVGGEVSGSRVSGEKGWVTGGNKGVTERRCGGRCPGREGTGMSWNGESGEGHVPGSGVSGTGVFWGGGWMPGGNAGVTKQPCGGRCPGGVGAEVSKGGVLGGGEGVTGESMMTHPPCQGRCPGGVGTKVSGVGGSWGREWVTENNVRVTKRPCGGKCPDGVGTDMSGGGETGGGGWATGNNNKVTKRPCGEKCPAGVGSEVSSDYGESMGGGWVTGDSGGESKQPCGGRCSGSEYDYNTGRQGEEEGSSGNEGGEKGEAATDKNGGQNRLPSTSTTSFGLKSNDFTIIGGRGSRPYTLPYLLPNPPLTFLGAGGTVEVSGDREGVGLGTGIGDKVGQGAGGWIQTTGVEKDQGHYVGSDREWQGSGAEKEEECEGWVEAHDTSVGPGVGIGNKGGGTRVGSGVFGVEFRVPDDRRGVTEVQSGILGQGVTGSMDRRGGAWVGNGVLGVGVEGSIGVGGGNKLGVGVGNTKVGSGVLSIGRRQGGSTGNGGGVDGGYHPMIKPPNRVTEGYGRPTVPPFWSVVPGGLGFTSSTPRSFIPSVGGKGSERHCEESHVKEGSAGDTAGVTNNPHGLKVVTNRYGENYMYSWG